MNESVSTLDLCGYKLCTAMMFFYCILYSFISYLSGSWSNWM